MCSTSKLEIDLKSMTEGANALHFDLDDAFFGALEGAEVERGRVAVDVDVRRAGDNFELRFTANGTVAVPCDICLDDMEQPVEGSDVLAARLGDGFGGDESDVVAVDNESGLIDVTWFVYETIALGIPVRHVHPDGQCNPEMLARLHEHTPGETPDGGDDAPVDPRWSKLANLKQ